jgi:hypothetical protein
MEACDKQNVVFQSVKRFRNFRFLIGGKKTSISGLTQAKSKPFSPSGFT